MSPKWGGFKFSATRPPGKKFGSLDVEPPVGSGAAPWILGATAPTVEEREVAFDLGLDGCLVGGGRNHTFTDLWMEQATLNAEFEDPAGALQSVSVASQIVLSATVTVNGDTATRVLGTYRVTAGPSATITLDGNRTSIQAEDWARSFLTSRPLLGNTPIRFLTDLAGSGSPLSQGLAAYLALTGLSVTVAGDFGPGLPSRAIDETWEDPETGLTFTSSPYKRLDDPPVDMFTSPPTCIEFMQMLRQRYGAIFYLRLRVDGGVEIGPWGVFPAASIGISAPADPSSLPVSNAGIGVPLIGISRDVSPAGVTSRTDIGIVVFPTPSETNQPPIYQVRVLAEYRSGASRNPPDGAHGVICYWIQDQNGLHAPSNANVNPWLNAANADRVTASIDGSFIYGEIAKIAGINMPPFVTGLWLISGLAQSFDHSPMSLTMNWYQD